MAKRFAHYVKKFIDSWTLKILFDHSFSIKIGDTENLSEFSTSLLVARYNQILEYEVRADEKHYFLAPSIYTYLNFKEQIQNARLTTS